MSDSYARDRLARAAVTAGTHADPATRERALTKVDQWRGVVEGIRTGRLRIGSRNPVADLPVWATPRVVHGGFATGAAAAGGPLLGFETAYAARHDLPAERNAIFAQLIGRQGLAELDALVASGGYRVTVPEEAALLVVAWLVSAGDARAALRVLEAIGAYANRLRFFPEADATATMDADLVWREPAGEVAAALRQRQPDGRVETMRATLQHWNLMADRMLELWLPVVDGAPIDDVWRDRARALLADYDRLAAAHRPSRRHGGPKANLTVLRTAASAVLENQDSRTGLVHTVVADMLRRRGRPGSAQHTAVRAAQAVIAARPSHATLAHTVAERLSPYAPHQGIRDVEPLLEPVDGHAVPESVAASVRRATAATVEGLAALGLVPSAEVLAALIPQLTASVVASAYPDTTLQAIVGATYRAFRNRRSLLLLDLQSQVKIDELPWVQAVLPYRSAGPAPDTALRRVAGLAVSLFPATLLPNPLVRELSALSSAAGLQLPWVQELAADIFDGRFAKKYLEAAQLAGGLLADSLYARYYAIDYGAMPGKSSFSELCRRRAGTPRGHVAANGMIIEQGQILTTHNLATLVLGAGVAPSLDAARACFARAVSLAARFGEPEAHHLVKDAAYAWRHMIFHLALTDSAAFIAALPDSGPLGRAVAGLRDCLAGRPHTAFTGWTQSRHWILAPTVA